MTAAPSVAAPAAAAPEWQIWSALSIVYVVWGSTYLAIAIIVDSLPPMLTGGIRFALAGLLMLAFVVVRSGPRSLGSLDRRQLASAGVVGCLLATGGNGLVMVGEQSIASGLAALIIAAVPMWVVVLRRATGDHVARLTLVGVLIGFAGVALLLLPGGGGNAEPLGFLALVAASLSWATGTFLSSKLTMPSGPVLSTGVQMTIGGVLGIVIGLSIGEGDEVTRDALELDAVLAFAYLVVIGSLVAYTAYSWLLQNAPVSKVATYAYVNPVIAILLGFFFRDETITLTIFVGAAIIVGAVAMVVRTETARR